jgi:hypothetical protein
LLGDMIVTDVAFDVNDRAVALLSEPERRVERRRLAKVTLRS